MSDCDPEGQIFLYLPHTRDKFFFVHTFHFWNWVFDNAATSIAEVNHIVITVPWRLVTSLHSVTSTLTMAYHDILYNQYISNAWKFSIFIFLMGWIRVCEIRFASTGVIFGNPYPVCKKLFSSMRRSFNKLDVSHLEIDSDQGPGLQHHLKVKVLPNLNIWLKVGFSFFLNRLWGNI